MIRHKWEFNRPANEVAAAALKKQEFHVRRLQYWNGQFAKSDAALEASYKIVNGSRNVRKAKSAPSGSRMGTIAAMQSDVFESSMHSGVSNERQIQYDENLENLNNANRYKVEFHSAKIEEYGNWVSILEACGTSSYTLDQDDFLFFGLNNWNEENEIIKDEPNPEPEEDTESFARKEILEAESSGFVGAEASEAILQAATSGTPDALAETAIPVAFDQQPVDIQDITPSQPMQIGSSGTPDTMAPERGYNGGRGDTPTTSASWPNQTNPPQSQG
jgi:hypothetical protein